MNGIYKSDIEDEKYSKNEKILVLLFFSIFAGSLWYSGFGSADSAEHLPLLYRMIDKDYLVNDWFINSNSTYFNIRYPFNLIIFALFNILPNLEVIYFVLYIGLIFLIGLGTYEISKILGSGNKSALLSSLIMLLSANYLSLGGNFLIHNILSPSLISMTLIIWSLKFILEGKEKISAVCMGFSIFFHIVMGLTFSVVVIFSHFWSKRNEDKIVKNIIWVLGIIFVFILLSLPLIIGQSQRSLHLSASEFKQIIADLRHPHHYIPSSWSAITYFSFVSFIILFIFSFQHANIKIKKREFFIALFIFLMAGFILGTVFVEIIPVKMMISLQFFRLNMLVSFLGLLFIGNYLSKEVLKKESHPLDKVLAIMAIISLFHPYIVLIFAPLFILLKINKLKIEEQISKIKNIIGIVLAVFLVSLIVFISFTNFNIAKFNTVLIGTFLLKVLFIVACLIMLSYKNKIMKKVLVLLFALVLILAVLSGYPKVSTQVDESTKELYEYVSKNTDKKDVFLTPPDIEGFRTRANRAIVVDLNFPFDETSMREWNNRIKDITKNNTEEISERNRGCAYQLGNSSESYWGIIINPIIKFICRKDINLHFSEEYKKLDEQDLSNLYERYGFKYAVFEKQKSMNLSVFYENDKYIVYKMQS